jgi:hypothetical protein
MFLNVILSTFVGNKCWVCCSVYGVDKRMLYSDNVLFIYIILINKYEQFYFIYHFFPVLSNVATYYSMIF